MAATAIGLLITCTILPAESVVGRWLSETRTTDGMGLRLLVGGADEVWECVWAD